ncbi:WxL domain-containing protein [Lactococcus petauri]|uniref:WxL domain-containing protein n=1 Tax=Lactococcus petauri TaxID=1940789 RepID=UPI00254D31F8|nr:WxL domain-containing protein [Lactococcus petauri]
MKKTAYSTLAATVLLTSFAFGASTVLADEDGASMKSVGTISYVTDDSSVNPIDPMDPDPEKPITPTDPDDHERPTAGPLSIDYVSNLRFGEQKTTGTDMIYHAQLDEIIDSEGETISRPNFVQVTDKRGSNAGWHLTVTQDGQFKSGANELAGAVLTLDNATLSTPNGGIEPTASQAIALTPGSASDVLDAKEDQGTGTWLNRFGADEEEGKSSVTLSVPGKTKKVQGEYKTSLTWTLTDTPA